MAGSAAIGRALRADISRTMSAVMIRAYEAVVLATPVDTYHAASNWILSVGSPYTGVDGSRDAVSTAQQDQGLQEATRFDVGRHGKIFLRNNVEYLPFLDQGSSQQAPADFVANAFQSALIGQPRGRRTAVRKMLRGMTREAYRRRA